MKAGDILKIQLGLKASTDSEQIEDRLRYKPDVFEFYTSENDFTEDGLKRFRYDFEWIKSKGVQKIVMHHPMRFHGQFTELIAPFDKCRDLYNFIDKSTNDLLQLAFDYDAQLLVHGSYSRQTQSYINMWGGVDQAREQAYRRIDSFADLGKNHIMFENSISPIFYYGDEKEDLYIFEKGYRLACDTSHCFIKNQGSNEKLLASMKRLKEHVVHYHLVDSMGETHDSLPLGKGKIDWEKALPLMNDDATSIYEIILKDQRDASEQVASHEYLLGLADKLRNA